MAQQAEAPKTKTNQRLMDNEVNAEPDLQHPPKGAWLVSDRSGIVIGATNRNFLNATGFFFFGLFWNGLVSVFVVFAVACTLPHLGLTLPNSFPVPKTEDGADVSLRMTLLLWVAITPFALIGLGLVAAFLSNLFGRTEVRIIGSHGTIFTGVGKLGWKRRFALPQIRSVNLHRSYNSEGSDTVRVLMETSAAGQIKFGS